MSAPDEEQTRQEGPPRVQPAKPLEAGARVGRFVIQGILGEGGMGVVYAAVDPELARKVAVKLVRASGPDAQERLHREAQAMARLQHPNVVAIFDVGTFEQRVFLAMELVEGESVRTWLKTKRSVRDILRVFIDAGAGLSAAHAAGIVHRDFKPDNVLVDRAGRARVTDFGLARSAGDQAPATGDASTSSPDRLSSELTEAGVVIGTPAYMAPEQREAARTDARTDQFAFCVSLYEALYGKRPFGPDSRDTVRPPPPGSKVPARLRRILLRGLARNPDERWPSMSALLAALDRDPAARVRIVGGAAVLLAGGAVALWFGMREPARAACDDPEVAFGTTWTDENRAAVRAAFEQTQKAYAGQVFTTVAAALDKAAASWKTAHLEACRATRVRREQPAEVMLLRLACLERQRVQLASIADLLTISDPKTLERAVQGVFALPSTAECDDVRTLTKVAPPPTDPKLRGEIEALRLQLASASGLGVTKPTEALARYQPILERAKQIGYRPLQAEALFAVGVAQLSSGDSAGAKDSLDAAVLAAEASGLDRIAALGCARLVAITANRGRLEESRAWAARGHAILERIGGDPAIEAMIEFGVALTEKNSGDVERSVQLMERVVAARLKLYGPDHPDTLIARSNLASAYEEIARAEKAIEENEGVIAALERTVGPESPRLVLPLLNLALVRARNGDLNVEPVLERAAAIASTLPGKNHYRAGVSLITAEVHLLAGRAAESVEHATAAIELTREATGDKSDIYGWALTTHGAALAAQGKHREAIASLRAGLAVREALNSRLVALARDFTYLGEAELADGDRVAALRSLESAFELSDGRPRFPGEHARTQFALARAIIANKGDRDRARELAQEARAGVVGDKARGDAIDAFLAKLGPKK